MQEYKNDELVNSEIGEASALMKKAQKHINEGKVDRVTIASFSNGETIVLKGLQFKIRAINHKKKTLYLKLK